MRGRESGRERKEKKKCDISSVNMILTLGFISTLTPQWTRHVLGLPKFCGYIYWLIDLLECM